MACRTYLIMKRKRLLEQLDLAYQARADILAGKKVQSYAIGSRNLSRYQMSLTELDDLIRKLEADLEEVEAQLAGGNKRKSVAVVHRDW